MRSRDEKKGEEERVKMGTGGREGKGVGKEHEENTTKVRRILIIVGVLCDVLEALLHPHILLFQALLLLLQQDPSQLQLLQHGSSVTCVTRLTGTPANINLSRAFTGTLIPQFAWLKKFVALRLCTKLVGGMQQSTTIQIPLSKTPQIQSPKVHASIK